jgi:hypothetical protein
LQSFGVTIPSDWANYDAAGRFMWLDQNRQSISSFIADVAENLEIVSRAIGGKKVGPFELVKLWNFARKAK